MRKYGVLTLLLISLTSWGQGWQPQQGESGVMLWTQSHPPGPYLALRLEMRVRAAPSALLAVLRDTSRHQEWLPKSREVRVLATSGPDDELVYTRLESPWPVQDRELITRSHVSRRADCGLELKVWAEPDALRIRPGLVRIRDSSGRWQALPQGDGTTLIRLETYTNPGNNLPGWLVNPIAIKAALESFQAIRLLMEAQPKPPSRQSLLGSATACPVTP
ncbi:START domain-containing protein [Aeromonas tecta]|uniref:START domain-containing protein n=1 Tax=Aeromonas tecta TaxID=324617 RepID=UPI000681481A|nr:START domain-containing protein [Aeromonas tecta]